MGAFKFGFKTNKIMANIFGDQFLIVLIPHGPTWILDFLKTKKYTDNPGIAPPLKVVAPSKSGYQDFKSIIINKS